MASVMATFSLDVKAWSALAELARSTGVSKSELIRVLIHQEWERVQREAEGTPENPNVAETD